MVSGNDSLSGAAETEVAKIMRIRLTTKVQRKNVDVLEEDIISCVKWVAAIGCSCSQYECGSVQSLHRQLHQKTFQCRQREEQTELTCQQCQDTIMQLRLVSLSTNI